MTMTADEFRKILDRFHESLKRADDFVWRGPHPHLSRRPEWSLVLDQIWRDLNLECSRMKDAEGRTTTTLDQTAVQPTRPLPEPPARMSAAAANAEQIGKLQARVSTLEGEVRALQAIHQSDPMVAP